jgi:hypothetical protein
MIAATAVVICMVVALGGRLYKRLWRNGVKNCLAEGLNDGDCIKVESEEGPISLQLSCGSRFRRRPTSLEEQQQYSYLSYHHGCYLYNHSRSARMLVSVVRLHVIAERL